MVAVFGLKVSEDINLYERAEIRVEQNVRECHTCKIIFFNIHYDDEMVFTFQYTGAALNAAKKLQINIELKKINHIT